MANIEKRRSRREWYLLIARSSNATTKRGYTGWSQRESEQPGSLIGMKLNRGDDEIIVDGEDLAAVFAGPSIGAFPDQYNLLFL
jgi:hypothetical protein